MIKSERIAKKINEEILKWQKSHDKLIVAIDGYAGSGKTTVADFIGKQNPDVLVVHLDDFIHLSKYRKKMIKEAKDKSKVFEYNWYRYGDLEKLLSEFKTKNKGLLKLKIYDYDKNKFYPKKLFKLSKKILVIDGIFLFHSKHKIDSLFDKTIYLDTDFIKADKKRIARDKKRHGKKYVPESHPDSWVKYFKEAYNRYIKEHKPHKSRDVVFKV